MQKSTLAMVLLLLGLLAGMAAKAWLVPLPAVRPIPAASEFNVHRAAARLTDILGDQRPHPTDSAANDLVRERLLAQLTVLGVTPRVRDQIACNALHKARGVTCARVRNVVVKVGPAAGRHVLLSAHYDSSPVGPGAGDAGAGVATLLEVTHLLKDRPLKRPVSFLFNEGEELGLVGARAFLADPLSREVDSLVNLEARGTTGPANMFETNKPNAAAIAAFAKAVEVPVANSLSTDVYRLMPNYTDVNTFAERGWLTLNLAMIGNETRYHSAGDDLSALDLRSLQHMGDQTLALAGELANGAPAASGERIFIDVLGTELIILPLAVGLVLLAALLIAFAWLAWHRRSLGRAAATIIAALLLSAILAWAAQTVVGTLRPGMFWRAFPIFAQLAAYASAIAASLALLATIGKGIDAERLRAAYWLVFVALGGAVALLAPGGIIYFLLPPLIVLLGAFAGRSTRGAERLAAMAAIFLLFLTFGALLALLEELLSRGPIWLLAPLGALILLPALIESMPLIERIGRRASLAVGAVLIVAGWGVAAAVPAYSANKQQQFTIEHVADPAVGRSYWSVTNDGAPLPERFANAGEWRRAALPFSERKRWLTAAGAGELKPPQLQLVASQAAGAGRRVSLRITTNGAQSVALIAPEDADVRAAGSGAFVRPVDGRATDGRYSLRCFGRSCDGLVMEVVIGKPEPVEFIVLGWRPGLPPSAAALVRARPADARPQYAADASIAISRVRF